MSDEKRGFTVTDRRFWADGEEEDSRELEQDGTPDKPTYVQALEKALEDKERKLLKLADEHKKSLEDLSNARERIRKDVFREAEQEIKSILREFLEVLDNLDRAIEASDKAQSLESVVQGVVMVRDIFVNKLEMLGVTRIEALGKPFDPTVHEAMSAVSSTNPQEEGKVVAVAREGYFIGDSVLRPAGVIVARTPTD